MADGFVLSGGGTRGAYEIGVLKALEASGIRPRAIAGTSVGALNAALVLSQSIDGAEACWRRIADERLVKVNPRTLIRVITWLALAAMPIPGSRARAAVLVVQILKSILAGHGLLATLVRGGLLSTDFLGSLLDRYVDYEAVCRSNIEFYICVYQGNPLFTFVNGRTRYYRAQSLDPATLRSLLLASSAIPLLFPAGRIGDRLVYDGGLADNTPIAAMRNHDLDRIFVVYLRCGAAAVKKRQGEARLIEIAPSHDLGRFPRSTLMAAGEGEIQALLDLGYCDGSRVLSQV